MKASTIVLSIVCAVFFWQAANGQKTAIKINILSPIVRTINIAVEHAFFPKGSAQIGFFYSSATIKSLNIVGTSITPEYRFYLTGAGAPRGVYAGPFVRYRNFALKKEGVDAEADFTSLGLGAIIGHQWIFGERITLDIFVGPSFSSHSLKIKTGLPEDFKFPGGSGFGVRTGLTFGVAF